MLNAAAADGLSPVLNIKCLCDWLIRLHEIQLGNLAVLPGV